MPAAGRLGDCAQIPADVHGCPACPHPAIGPAVAGSPNTLINGRPALRVGDPGVHVACCNSNTWKAAQGAQTVFINGKAAYRKSDPASHCGGNGKLIQGSPNVVIGDTQTTPPGAVQTYTGGFTLHGEDGKPLAGCGYIITTKSGQQFQGETDEEGHTELVSTDSPEDLECEILGVPCQT